MTRRVWWYRIAIAIFLLGDGYLILSGRLAASYRFITAPLVAPSDSEFAYHFTTNFLWIAFLAPLALSVVWTANRDRSVTAGAAYWRAIRTVVGVAWRGAAHTPLEEATDTIEDDSFGTLMKGLSVAALVPSFFWFGPAPIPHTVHTGVWLVLTGLMMGASVYCLERARPFLTRSWHEAQRGRLFRRWYSPYPVSYDPPGNRWIAWHWVFLVLGGVCWLGGFALVVPLPVSQ